jgi:hypothetical protein
MQFRTLSLLRVTHGVDFDQAFHACTDRDLLACDHQCFFELVSHQNLYDNHPGLEVVTDEVQE